MPMTSDPASAPGILAAVAALCLRARRECSSAYFRLIEEMLRDDAALATATADIRRLCRWRPMVRGWR